MTRKRKQPDRRQNRKRKKTLAGRLFRLTGAAIARHPSLAGGTAAFAVVFGFVSANAVWYQPGAHPDPLLSTRNRLAHMARAKPVAVHASAASLTINSVIASASPKSARSLPQSPDAVPTGSIPRQNEGSAQPPEALVLDIQKALADRQFYNGPLDGKDGGKTQAAIEAFQAATATHLTGKPTRQLLAAINATHRDAVVIPRARPADRPQAGNDTIASIASLPDAVAVPAPRPGGVDAASSHASAPGTVKLVARIQAGLRNIAYSNVAVDGIAGAKTKAAIRNFETNYRLPVTGKPNKRVLKKLVAIGAL